MSGWTLASVTVSYSKCATRVVSALSSPARDNFLCRSSGQARHASVSRTEFGGSYFLCWGSRALPPSHVLWRSWALGRTAACAHAADPAFLICKGVEGRCLQEHRED